MSARPASDRVRVMALREDGLGFRAISRETGVPESTVARWIYPRLAEQTRIASRDRKRAMKGECVDCGARTGYDGHGGTSERCRRCGPRAAGKARLNKGPILVAVVDLLGEGRPVTYTEIRDAIVAAGGKPLTVNPTIFQRLIPRGLAVRVRRGVYVAGPELR